MGRRLDFLCHLTLAGARCKCAAHFDEMDGFTAKDLTCEELQVLLYNAILSTWRYYLANPIYNYPHLWTLGRVIRSVLAKDLVDFDIEIKSDVFDVLAVVRFSLGDPISIGRFCALCAWCAHLCRRNSLEESWLKCGEIAKALKKCL